MIIVLAWISSIWPAVLCLGVALLAVTRKQFVIALGSAGAAWAVWTAGRRMQALDWAALDQSGVLMNTALAVGAALIPFVALGWFLLAPTRSKV